ncbi:MAG: M24 family metallopeptidase, partial [bacterium]|nr:M24 family metallopeptidase [bacterium]
MSTMPKVLPLRERARIVNNLTLSRFETLLPQVMRETGFDMWLIICHEDNHDPIFNTLIPWECWAPILQMVVFYDNGSEIERINISRTNMQNLMPPSPWNTDEEEQWACLKRIAEERNPKRIGINQSNTIWAADGLTVSLKEQLTQTLGSDLASRLASSEPLCIRWLETLVPEEMELYHHANAVAHHLIRRVFFRETITPGITTIEDMRWAYWQNAADLGFQVSFPPFFRIYRSDANKEIYGDVPTVRHGDMLHCDVGVIYFRLNTDHQELAYVLRPEENDAPDGLKHGMAEGNRLQNIFTSSWEMGLSGNDILARALQRANEANIPSPKIYSHSLGHFLHEPGPLMGLPWDQGKIPGRGDVKMNPNTCYTVELSVTCPVPEWNNQEVTFPLEQD